LKRKVFFLTLLTTLSLQAHEVRPARLQINQDTDTTYNVFWKLPAIKLGVLKLKPVFEFDHEVINRKPNRDLGDAYIESWTIKTTQPLDGARISIEGLANTITDVFVSYTSIDGESTTTIVRPEEPFFQIAETRSKFDIIKDFVILGVEHIWLGYDHLLFVLCLVWLITGLGKLLKTITAFTLAHSITLCASALGYMALPGPPVEAVIALSIVFLTVEIIRHQHGEEVYTSKYPWSVALVFGLLHGFGFAGALSEIGLPESAKAISLFGFNLGVEIGQVIFILIIIALVKVMNTLIKKPPRGMSTSIIYAIGSLAAFWLIERVVGFW